MSAGTVASEVEVAESQVAAEEERLREEGAAEAGEEAAEAGDGAAAEEIKNAEHAASMQPLSKHEKKAAWDKVKGGLNLDDVAMTHDQWVKYKERKERIEKKDEEKQLRRHQYDKAIHRGDWYWHEARFAARKDRFCFYDSEARAADFWEPLEGEWVYEKHPLPIYYQESPGTPPSRCSLFHQDIKKYANGKKHRPVWRVETEVDCDATSVNGNPLQLRFKPSGCQLRPLYDVTLAQLLEGRTVWIVGDSIAYQQYEALTCMLSMLHFEKDELVPGRTTGATGPSVSFGDGKFKVNFMYAGLYQEHEDPEQAGIEARNAFAANLTEFSDDDLQGLPQDLQEFLKDPTLKKGQDARWLSQELADIIEERMDEYRPGDVILANIGQDYSDPRSYQQALLKFMRLYERRHKELPVIIWRETTAQHHQAHRGGDITQPEAAAYGHEVRAGSRTYEQRREIQCGVVPPSEFDRGNWRNKMANRLLEAARIPILRVWKASTMRHDWYRNYCDRRVGEKSGWRSYECDRWGPCMHFCKGPMTTLFNELFQGVLESQALQATFLARDPTLGERLDLAHGTGAVRGKKARREMKSDKRHEYRRRLETIARKRYAATNQIFEFEHGYWHDVDYDKYDFTAPWLPKPVIPKKFLAKKIHEQGTDSWWMKHSQGRNIVKQKHVNKLSEWQKGKRRKYTAEQKAAAKAKAKAHKKGAASPWKNKARGDKAELPKLLPASHPKRGLGAKKAKYRERAKQEKKSAPKKGSKKP